MSSVVALVARFGEATADAFAGARRLPRYLREAFAVPRYVAIGLGVALGYMLVYLIAIGDLQIATGGRFGRFADIPSAQLFAGWEDRLFDARAPYLYESFAVVYLLPQLAFFVSIGNLLVATGMGLLLAANIALALFAVSRVASCRRRGVAAPAFGLLPTLLMGFACCAPTLLLALGANVAAAFLPVFLPLRQFLLPFAGVVLAAMLVWSARKLVGSERALAEAAREVVERGGKPSRPREPARA